MLQAKLEVEMSKGICGHKKGSEKRSLPERGGALMPTPGVVDE